jgi:hypothetical protein
MVCEIEELEHLFDALLAHVPASLKDKRPPVKVPLGVNHLGTHFGGALTDSADVGTL